MSDEWNWGQEPQKPESSTAPEQEVVQDAVSDQTAPMEEQADDGLNEK